MRRFSIIQEAPLRRGFRATIACRGLEQLDNVPSSTTRIPRGKHRGPGKRQTSLQEADQYRFMKKWDLVMNETWDDVEAFKGLPKPKKQFGNEACEIVWPYSLLMEKYVQVHPFTKSIYVYYSSKQQTSAGLFAAAVAKRFSREYLIPITFHNSQVYVETEMLLEYNETPWIVVHCMDGRHEVLPLCFKPSATLGASETKQINTELVKKAAEQVMIRVATTLSALGSSVEEPKSVTRLLHERPLQNQYLRINYQWFGDTAEERSSHLVQWDAQNDDAHSIQPTMRHVERTLMDWLNFDGLLPTSTIQRSNMKDMTYSHMRHEPFGVRSFMNTGARQHANHGKLGGAPK